MQNHQIQKLILKKKRPQKALNQPLTIKRPEHQQKNNLKKYIMNLEENEKYHPGDAYFQDEKNQYKEDNLDGTALDNSVTNDEEQNLNQSLSNQDRDDDLDDENDNDLERDLDEDLDDELDQELQNQRDAMNDDSFGSDDFDNKNRNNVSRDNDI